MAIVKRLQLNLESVRSTFIKDGFTIEDLRPSMFTIDLKDEKKGLSCHFNKKRQYYPGAY